MAKRKSSPSKHASAAAYQREQSKAFGPGYLKKARLKKAKAKKTAKKSKKSKKSY